MEPIAVHTENPLWTPDGWKHQFGMITKVLAPDRLLRSVLPVHSKIEIDATLASLLPAGLYEVALYYREHDAGANKGECGVLSNVFRLDVH